MLCNTGVLLSFDKYMNTAGKGQKNHDSCDKCHDLRKEFESWFFWFFPCYNFPISVFPKKILIKGVFISCICIGKKIAFLDGDGLNWGISHQRCLWGGYLGNSRGCRRGARWWRGLRCWMDRLIHREKIRFPYEDSIKEQYLQIFCWKILAPLHFLLLITYMLLKIFPIHSCVCEDQHK